MGKILISGQVVEGVLDGGVVLGKKVGGLEMCKGLQWEDVSGKYKGLLLQRKQKDRYSKQGKRKVKSRLLFFIYELFFSRIINVRFYQGNQIKFQFRGY